MLLVIDNYDSFTYNLVQCFGALGASMEVVRNDARPAESFNPADYSGLVISPGPGTPNDAGVSMALIRSFGGKVPVLGICLGHQAIGQVFGGRVVRGPRPVHGKSSEVVHCGSGIFSGLPQPLPVGRYHSLVVERSSLPGCLQVTAETTEGLIMGLRHTELGIEGVQFHPESVMTEHGTAMLAQFLKRTAAG